MQSPIPTNYALPRPSYQTADPFFLPNRSGSIRRPDAVLSCQSYSRRCCGVKIACGIHSRDQNLQVQSTKDSESSIDSAIDARYGLSSAVNDQQPPSAWLLQPLSQPRAPMQELRLHVAYQGFPGSYSEVATGSAYPNCEAIPCDLFKTVFKAVELGVVDHGIIPVENSIGGLIHANYDLLLENPLHVVGEVNLPIHQCLLALPGVRFEHLSRVVALPASLAQCEHNLIKLIPAATYEAVDDSAGAAEYIAANKLRDTAAIASSLAAEIFGLQVLADSIGDDSSNVTRFVKLARELLIPVTDQPFKTSIVIAHDQGAGVLFGMLSAFESRGISLTKIVTWPRRSRPIRIAGEVTKELFECLSYVDLAVSTAEERMQDALSEVRKVSSFLRVLGSYPMEVMPTGWQ